MFNSYFKQTGILMNVKILYPDVTNIEANGEK